MTRADISEVPEYFTLYTKLIPAEMTIHDALQQYGIESVIKETANFKALGDQIYAPDKWTTKQTLVHIIDAERVFAYRAMRFGRGDKTPLAGFEQDDYVANAKVDNRSVEEIIEEFKVVRSGTIHLFNSFDAPTLGLSGLASGKPVSVLALGFMACGHLEHHLNIFSNKYYPLLSQ